MSGSYSTQLVVLSIVIACVASYAALDLAGHVARRRAQFGWLLGAAFAMGIGIWSMHFIAMLAFRLPVAVGYDVPLVLASLLIAIGASGIGLRVAGQVTPRPAHIALAGPIMGLAIAGMHYTGMASMRLPAVQHYDRVLFLTSILVAVVASYAAIALFLRFRFDRSRRGLWLKIASAVVMGHAVAGMHYTAMAAVHFEPGMAAASGVILPPEQLAIAIAMATVLILALIVSGAMLDRWMDSQGSIRRSEERFRAMVDALQDHAIFTLDAQGRIDSWNKSAEKMTGRTATEVIGLPLSDLYPTPNARDAEHELAMAREHGRHEAEGIRIDRHGKVLRVSATTTVMRSAGGRLLGYARIVRDVTEKARAEEELRQSEAQLRQAQKMEAVGQLAGGVAHDFNNMLTAIRGYADLLRDDVGASTDTHASLSEIITAADRAAALTRQLLAFSRKQMLQPKPINPNDMVAEMERMLSRLMLGGVDLAMELSPDVGQITADPAQLQQVLLNLALNARDALPRGGRVKFGTSNVILDEAFCREHPGARPGEHVLLTVSDNGVGMSKEIQQHIFEPFFTTKPLGAGTGLGLSTVYGIVKQSDGYIDFDSEEGDGTTFRIYFPRTLDHASEPTVRPVAAATQAKHETILLVDDEDGVRRMLATLLSRSGYRVLQATSGTEALDVSRAHEGKIHLLITDIMMPGMNGRELSQLFIAQRPDARVLYTSGYASDEIIERGLLDRDMAFIQKPFVMSELLAKVRGILELRLAQAG